MTRSIRVYRGVSASSSLSAPSANSLSTLSVARHCDCAFIASRKYLSAALPGRFSAAAPRRASSAKIAFSASACPTNVACALVITPSRTASASSRIAS